MEEREIIKYKENFKKIAKRIVCIAVVLTIICFIISGILSLINQYHINKKYELNAIREEKLDIRDEKYKNTREIYEKYEKIYKTSGNGVFLENLENSKEYQNANKEYDVAVEEAEKAANEYHNYDYEYYDKYTPFYLGCIFGVCIIITIVFYWYISKMEITVTTTRVYGKKAFGKRVDLPLDTISAVGTSFLKGIDIGTSSGRIHFKGIMNNNEIHAEISKLLNTRQSTTQVKEKNISNAEELKKYKELLDSGIITQEEFNAKKKQLLGL